MVSGWGRGRTRINQFLISISLHPSPLCPPIGRPLLGVERLLDEHGVVLLLRGHHAELAREAQRVLVGGVGGLYVVWGESIGSGEAQRVLWWWREGKGRGGIVCMG